MSKVKRVYVEKKPDYAVRRRNFTKRLRTIWVSRLSM